MTHEEKIMENAARYTMLLQSLVNRYAFRVENYSRHVAEDIRFAQTTEAFFEREKIYAISDFLPGNNGSWVRHMDEIEDDIDRAIQMIRAEMVA
jgi:hypothetical protein